MMAESTLFVFRSVLRICSYFNPRTPVGCDLNGMAGIIGGSLFQSTHPSGVRHTNLNALESNLNISIHAPQWGATADALRLRLVSRDFNPRTPVGCDSSESMILFSNGLFQSTHPSGVRRKTSTHTPSTQPNFNPRTPVGCDLSIHEAGLRLVISIHAPQWGATAGPEVGSHAVGISIHAPQWGATVHGLGVRVDLVISIHAPQWGATPAGFGGAYRGSRFQSTHPSGVRLRRMESYQGVPCNFNPRTPVGCDFIQFT